MRNAMNSGFLSPVMPEGGPAFARPGSTDERLGGYQYGYAFSPGPSAPPGADYGGVDQQSDATGGLQGTQDMAPMPTLADLPPMPAFGTMTPFLPYQQPTPMGQAQQAPLNYMARSAYARPPAAPYGRMRGFGGYGSAYGRGAGLFGGMGSMSGLSQYGRQF